MDDLTMLELAAKAAGIVVRWHSESYYGPTMEIMEYESGGPPWNPLTDDGDALRLAVKLGLVIDCSRPSCGEPFKRHTTWLDELMSNEELTRRAIIRAAAEIQLAKESK